MVYSFVSITVKINYFVITSVIFIPEQIYKTESNCTCTVPCERIVYEPKLSYAQLSHFNVKTFVAGSSNQQEKLEVQSFELKLSNKSTI